MINEHEETKSITIHEGKEHDTLVLKYHNENTADDMAILFRQVMFVMGFTKETIDEVIPDPIGEEI